jgi:uncharacterized protein
MAEIGIAGFLMFIGIGLGVGAYGTMIGAGGGFVLMPLLLLLDRTGKPQTVTAVSLAVVFANALSGSAAYARMRRIEYRSGLMFAAAAIPGAVVGALNTSLVSRGRFDLIFSAALVAVALFMIINPELRHRPLLEAHKTRFMVRRHLVDADGKCYQWSFMPLIGIVLSFFVGYFSSFLGIGGGVIHVPALVWLLHFPVHIATATSHFILACMALAGTVTHIIQGSFTPRDLYMTLALGIGVIIGAQGGAYLSRRIRSTWIIRSLAVALAVVGLRMLVMSLKL